MPPLTSRRPRRSPRSKQAEGRRRAEDYRKGVEKIRNGKNPAPKEQGDAPRELERDGQRSKHFQPPIGASEQDSEYEELDQ